MPINVVLKDIFVVLPTGIGLLSTSAFIVLSNDAASNYVHRIVKPYDLYDNHILPASPI